MHKLHMRHAKAWHWLNQKHLWFKCLVSVWSYLDVNARLAIWTDICCERNTNNRNLTVIVLNLNDTALYIYIHTFQYCWNRSWSGSIGSQKSKCHVVNNPLLKQGGSMKKRNIRLSSFNVSVVIENSVFHSSIRIWPSWRHKLVFHVFHLTSTGFFSIFHNSHDFFDTQKTEFTFFLRSYLLTTSRI